MVSVVVSNEVIKGLLSSTCVPIEESFLQATNGKCRVRLFNSSDYNDFLNSIQSAKKNQLKGEPFYEEEHTGGVAKAYGSTTTTAYWHVRVEPKTFQIHFSFGRKKVSGPQVPCSYHGGEMSYLKEFRKGK